MSTPEMVHKIQQAIDSGEAAPDYKTAMDRYAKLYRKARAELDDLRQWKKSAMSVMPDFQSIGRALGLTLGSDVSAEILPGIERLQRELAEALKPRPTPITDAFCEQLDDHRPNFIAFECFATLARSIERRLAEARESVTAGVLVFETFRSSLAKAMDDAGAPTHHPDIGAPARKPMMPQEWIQSIAAQRDRLAEALKMVLDEVGDDYLACKEEIKSILETIKP